MQPVSLLFTLTNSGVVASLSTTVHSNTHLGLAEKGLALYFTPSELLDVRCEDTLKS